MLYNVHLMTTMKYKAIFFDFDDTLVHADPPVFDVLLPACEAVGLSFDEEQVREGHRFLYEYFSGSSAQEEFQTLKGDLEQFHFNLTTNVLVNMGVEHSKAQSTVQSEKISVALPQGRRCYPEVFPVLNSYKEQGYLMGVITNNGSNIAESCVEHGLDHYFEFVISRIDAGCSKPDAGIFEAALNHVGIKAKEAVHVGDNYYADVVGARNVGITPVLLDNHKVFADADCHVIHQIDQLLDVI